MTTLPSAVLFDAGGTLINVDYDRVRAVLSGVLGWAPPAQAFVEAEYAGRAAVEQAMARTGAANDGARWDVHFAAMLEALGYSAQEFARVAPEIRTEHQRANLWTVPQRGAAHALAGLRRAGLITGCVSNADGTVDRLLEQAGLLEHLDFVVDSGVVGVEKPDPRIFAIALGRAGVEPEDAVYVGDLYPVDVVGARDAGIEPVLLDPLGRYADRDCRTARDVPTFCDELVSSLSDG